MSSDSCSAHAFRTVVRRAKLVAVPRVKKPTPEGFPRNLREAMHRADMNQTELSEASGIDQSQIGRYLSGERKPLAESVVALAKALGVTQESLYGESGVVAPRVVTVERKLPPPELKQALDTFDWPSSVSTDTVQEISDALTNDAFKRGTSYIPTSHWERRIRQEIAARKGKLVQPMNEGEADDDGPSPEMRAHKASAKKRRAS